MRKDMYTIIGLLALFLLCSPLVLFCAFYLLLVLNPRWRIWRAQFHLARRAHCSISRDEAILWLAMRHAVRRGFWHVKEHAHE